MSSRQILFVQGGGADVHDRWDNKLVDDLADALGSNFRIRYPRMPQEDDPSHRTWGPVITRELEALEDGSIAIGHSVGGTILMNTLANRPSDLGLIVMLGAPYVGVGGWHVPGFELPPNLGARIPPAVAVHLFHGSVDQTVPPSHMDLYARAIPQAHAHLLPGRDHQLNNDLSEVATLIDSDRTNTG